jgi:hypothetical protein
MPSETPTGTSVRTPPSSRQSGTPSERAHRSQKAISTAATAMLWPRTKRRSCSSWCGGGEVAPSTSGATKSLDDAPGGVVGLVAVARELAGDALGDPLAALAADGDEQDAAVLLDAEAGLEAESQPHGDFAELDLFDAHGPAGLTVVRPEEALGFLAELPIERFFGVGPKTAARLQAVGIATGADLRARDEDELHELLGKLGGFLHRVVRDDDPRPVVPDRARKSIGAERTFPHDMRDANELAPELAKACANVGGRLERAALAARTVTVKVRYADFRIVTRSATPPNPVADAAELWPVAERLAFGTPRPAGAVRLIGVAASGLMERSARVVQPELFVRP